NDDALALATFTQDGLRIRLDAAPDPASLTTDTVQVMVEAPYQTSTLGVVRVYLDGTVTRDAADPRTIVWKAATPASPPNTIITGPISVLVNPSTLNLEKPASRPETRRSRA